MKTKQELHLEAIKLLRKRDRLATKLLAIDLEIVETEKALAESAARFKEGVLEQEDEK